MFKKSLGIIIALTCLGSIYADAIGINSPDQPYLPSDLCTKLPSTSIDTSKKNSMVYCGVGINNVCYPSAGLGWRYQKQKQAFDIYGSISSLLVVTCVDINFSYLYGSKFYIGPGIGIGSAFGMDLFNGLEAWTYGAKAVCGIKITDKMFFQIEPGLIVVEEFDGWVLPLPSVGIRFGTGF